MEKILGRSNLSSIPEQYLHPIQKGTLNYEWKGIECFKNPFDLALYSMLIWRVKARTIIELGTYSGGSALWLADLTKSFDLDTRILSIDIEQKERFFHPRIEFRHGDAEQLSRVIPEDEMKSLKRPLVVIEDSSHKYETSLAVLRFFDPWMRPGEYLLIEDGIADSFGVEGRYNGGPNRAIAEFMAEAGDRFVVDETYCDYFGPNVTWNTNGYLKRV